MSEAGGSTTPTRLVPGRSDAASTYVIIGAGPAGLTAAHALVGHGCAPIVFEGTDTVGGIARTVERDGWRFDIGGHRFYTKVPEVKRLWHEMLPAEHWLTRRRRSRIHFDGRFYDYPLRVGNVLRNLGVVESVRCLASYAWVRVRPPRDQSHFEGWVAARFGWRLYRMFFETYTEKVWGTPPSQIQADWAAQRIKNLSLLAAVVDAVVPRRRRRAEITSLITEFEYPTHGPGMLWEHCCRFIEEAGCDVRLETAVEVISRVDGVGATAIAVTDAAGSTSELPVDHVISTMPLGALVLAMDPPAPAAVRRAASALRYRDFLTVALVVPIRCGFPDNWIYIHSPEVRVGRIQNFGSWSPAMATDTHTCLGLEYFVAEDDELWSASDDELVELATRELSELGLIDAALVDCGYVVRMPKAYPVYDDGFDQHIGVLREWLSEVVPNVHPVGRNGMHKYNNQDHSMMTALLTVENIVLGTAHDVWAVNVDEVYLEERDVPATPTGPTMGTGRSAPIVPRAPVSGLSAP
jgi:protoporphyrinogen oxidase